jgi:hypothetical protein
MGRGEAQVFAFIWPGQPGPDSPLRAGAITPSPMGTKTLGNKNRGLGPGAGSNAGSGSHCAGTRRKDRMQTLPYDFGSTSVLHRKEPR